MTSNGNVTLHPFVFCGRTDAKSNVASIGFAEFAILGTTRRSSLHYSLCGRLELQFPKHVDDFPFAVEFCDFEIIDPIGRNDLHDGSVVVTIEDCYLFQLSILRRLFPAAVAGPLDERHRAHVIELASPRFW